MRTGTSKSVYFHKKDLPEDTALRDKYLLAVMGSPDIRQIDGMGGGDVSTSKVAIIAKADSADYDIEYTFGQVSLKDAKIDYAGNCGNCSSGVGPFAIDEGLIAADGPVTTVRIFNTNTRRLLIAHVRTENGAAAIDGDCEIDGVPGAWAPIDLDFRDTVGATTGKLFPTGARTDVLEVPEIGDIAVTIADLGNPVVFFPAAELGATGYESRPEINGNESLMTRIEAVRQKAAEAIGLVRPGEIARQVSSMKPLVVMFAGSQDYKDYVTGNEILAKNMDFSARNIMNQSCIDTFAATAALCTGVVARIPGTVLHVAALASVREGSKEIVAIGQSRGVSEVAVAVTEKDGEIRVAQAIMQRTARRILKGEVYIQV